MPTPTSPRGPSDITTPGDMIQGVPNDGLTTGGEDNGWPAAETPDLVIDNDVNTKYLHFKGEVEPTGFQMTPVLGSTLVTGLTLTTANDCPRARSDPVRALWLQREHRRTVRVDRFRRDRRFQPGRRLGAVHDE